ncbi:RloB family protein [Flavobacterium caeni]|uniref:RloB-like protein n=1 Tax=Flavobacterium caeni TaxID=490189 RepID=A0A1G5KEF9_9FLAO|nr:RloB family protein [Flavobacterium caeni]SCY98319.1 RloB-like protein [Flavobacterium caeni]
MHKKRGYKRETPIELVRDYKLFAIACEGSKREPEYFKILRYLSKKIAVDVIEDIVSEEEAISINPNKSAPKWVLDRAVRYIEKEGLNDDDDLWFVMDIDRWSEAQIREVASYCDKFPNWHIVLSNPCFEVWLYFHKKANIATSESITCSDFKTEISTFEKGGYHPHKFLPQLEEAIANAKNADSDKNHFIPKVKETKVYILVEAIIEVVGKNDFENFIKNILPKLPNK